MKTEEKDERAQKQALSKLESIMEMVQNLNSDNDEDREDALERIYEHPLAFKCVPSGALLEAKWTPLNLKFSFAQAGQPFASLVNLIITMNPINHRRIQEVP